MVGPVSARSALPAALMPDHQYLSVSSLSVAGPGAAIASSRVRAVSPVAVAPVGAPLAPVAVTCAPPTLPADPVILADQMAIPAVVA